MFDNNNSTSAINYDLVQKEGQKLFVCTHFGCGKSFRYKSEMERHIVKHNESRPFVCSFPNCEKSFKRKDVLDRHYKIHMKKVDSPNSQEGHHNKHSNHERTGSRLSDIAYALPPTFKSLSFQEQCELINQAINMNTVSQETPFQLKNLAMSTADTFDESFNSPASPSLGEVQHQEFEPKLSKKVCGDSHSHSDGAST